MNILFWALLLLMLLVAVVIMIYPLLRVRQSDTIAYKDSNLGLYDDKLAELEADLGEGRIEHEQYQLARQEIDRELLQDIPAESRETASLHYAAQVKRQPALALMISVFLPTVALLVYMKLGMHASTQAQHAQMQQAAVQQQAAESAFGGRNDTQACRAHPATGRFQGRMGHAGARIQTSWPVRIISSSF